MKNSARFIAFMVSLFFVQTVWGQLSRYDLEDVYFKDSVDQVYQTIQQNLIIKLTPEQMRAVDTIRITGNNQIQDGLTKHTASINPRTGFVIKSNEVRSVIRQYLVKELSFDQAEAQIRRLQEDPALTIHPLVFLDPENSSIIIKMLDQNSGRVSFNYEVSIEYPDGYTERAIEDQVATITRPITSRY